MCRFPNTGGLYPTSGDAPLKTHNLIHHNTWQPITNCRKCAERIVIEDAVEGNSWGRSECEWMCHVPNTERLYHTSVDAPLETHNNAHNTTWQPRSNWGVIAGRSIEEDAVGHNKHPPWCHVSKSNLRHLKEPKWLPMPKKTNHTSLQGVPQNTKGESMPKENGINRLNISNVCKYVMSHQTGEFNI
jgi:hypothetical protein